MGTSKRERQKVNRQLRLQELAKQARRDRTRRLGLRLGIGIPLGLLVVFGLVYLLSDDDGSTTAPTTTTTTAAPTTTVAPGGPPAIVPFTYGTGECAPETPGEPQQGPFSDAPQQCIDPTKTYTATFVTSEGTIEVELDGDVVPGTVNNFVNLARFGYYDDTIIFRADPSLEIIQGGGMSNTATPGYDIPDEGTGFSYAEGDLVMARTAAPNSAGGQWFFVAGPAASVLDAQGTYVTFGHVTSGIDVVKAILGLAGDDGQTPTREVRLESVTITESDASATTTTVADTTPASGSTTDTGTTPASTSTSTAAP